MPKTDQNGQSHAEEEQGVTRPMQLSQVSHITYIFHWEKLTNIFIFI